MSANAVTRNPRIDSVTSLIPLEALNVQTYLAGKPFEDRTNVKRLVPGPPVFVQQVVHLPELALQPGRFGSVRSCQRVRVQLRDRELAEDNAQARAILSLDRREH